MIRTNSPHLIEDGQFNKIVLKEFLQKIIDLFHKKYKEEKDLDVSDEEISAMINEENRKFLLEKFHESEENLDELIKKLSLAILDAFDWVLKYYREGCPSWKWHYPFHYSPPLELILPYIDEHESEFEEEYPNKPLIQLLAVLPPQSRDLLPEEIQPLIDSDELKDFYPEKFETDLNGRKAEWQATVLIPQIDIDLLEEKFNEIELSEELEESLNKVEFPLEFTNGIEYEETYISKGEIPFHPVNLSTEMPTGIPTFENLDNIKFEEKVVPVKIFEYPTTKPSIVIHVEKEKQTVKDIQNLLNTKVLINWPYLRPAKVVGMMDEENIYNPNSKTIVPSSKGSVFPSEKCHDDLMTSKALDLGSISVFLSVVAQNRDSTYETRSRTVPINLVVPLNEDPQKIVKLFDEAPPVEEPKEGDTVVFIGGTAQSGVGTIVKKEDEKGKFYTVNVRLRLYPPIRQIFKDDLRRWVTFQDLVKSVGKISFRGLRICLSTITLEPSKVNIALTLLTYDHKVIEGCCKLLPEDNQYVFAGFVPQLVKEYFSLTGQLKTIVMDSVSKKEKALPKITLEMLYGGSEKHQNECYEKLIDWLSKKAPAVKFPLVSDTANFISPEGLSNLENKIKSFDFNEHDEVTEGYDADAILWRMKPNPKPLNDVPKVGQRVVSIASSGPATFGEIGTVIETDPRGRSVTVLFDKVLPYGTRLEGRLDTNRGVRMNINNIIVVCGS